jgi:hypothetical protein
LPDPRIEARLDVEVSNAAAALVGVGVDLGVALGVGVALGGGDVAGTLAASEPDGDADPSDVGAADAGEPGGVTDPSGAEGADGGGADEAVGSRTFPVGTPARTTGAESEFAQAASPTTTATPTISASTSRPP